MTTNPRQQINTSFETLHMAIELSASTWKIAFADSIGRRPRIRAIDAGDFDKLLSEIAAAKKAFRLDSDAPIISCYEAGRDGFWIHRSLVAIGIESHIVEPASIQVNRKKRRAKTDRIDAQKIVAALIRWKSGDRFACRMIRVPQSEDEDARHLNREMRTIKTEKTAHTNRLKSLLAAQGITNVTINRHFEAFLEKAQTGDGRNLESMLQARLLREFERLKLAVDQIRVLQMQQAELFRRAAAEVEKDEKKRWKACRQAYLAYQLHQLVGIGPVTAWTLASEVFAWRDIANRRQLGALAGLTPTPHASGNEEREQGISKSGRAEIRTLMIEIAWGWLKFQPQSDLARWYRAKFGDGTKRSRKIGIVALARKLLVALGKFVRMGEIPEGAKMRDELKFNYQSSLQSNSKGTVAMTTAA